ncbi:hypothetical protein NEOLI_000145 [Neolecta irregularis DAH-3]|uniref:Uncharacterized protein n=1 Tax=Neolecta irregularis (strain DAH-3) TaxID=1198029 RepID=A0A1U7LQY0_NEOID|nr:hypothetical protein NEOLI_000145 [Neolecta irregularis DAH-3]|eukprot:OLL25039.1 hypothetical protein NEOLI_000145 [Neolecta irregularis DAH-3]
MATTQATSPQKIRSPIEEKLDRFLARRPDPQDLKDTSVAPSLIAKQDELKLWMKKDELSHQLECRPTPEDLIRRGILNEGESPVRLKSQAPLKERLEDFFEHRPAAQELKDRNIMKDSSAAPALIAKQDELKQRMTKTTLEHNLQNRPELDTVIAQGILNRDEDPRTTRSL